MTLAGVLAVIAMTLLSAFASLQLKLGSEKLRGKGRGLLRNRGIALGLLLYLCSTVLYVSLLRTVDLSVLYPVSSLTYVWVIAISKIYLGESPTRTRLASIACILAGILLITR